MPRQRASILALAGVLLSASCATYSDRTEAARAALGRADYDGSIRELDKYLGVKDSELPDKWKKNFVLVVLERATVLQAKREYELSARDFQVADKELEILDIARDGAGKIGKYIYSDDATKYKASPTEKLSLNAMNMCNYLARADLDGAKIEAKRFTVMRKYISDYDPKHEHGAFGSYLAGFVYERLGNPDEALRYYEEALTEREFGTLREVIPRLARRGSFRGERILDYLPDDMKSGFVPPASTSTPASPTEAPATPEAGEAPPVQRPAGGELGALPPRMDAAFAPAGEGEGEILVVAKVGRVPYKVPQRIPIGLAIGLAGTFITGDPRVLEHTMFKVVTYPELQKAGNLFDNASVSVDGHPIAADLATDLGVEIAAEYEELRPKIIGAAISRMIVRAVAAEGARVAGQQAEGAGGLVGFLAAAAVEGTMVALDKPDTRSWATLPERVFVARSRVPAGAHTVRVEVSGPGGRETHEAELTVPPGGFAVLDVTTLR